MEPRPIDVNKAIDIIRRAFIRRERNGYVYSAKERTIVGDIILLLQSADTYHENSKS